MTRPPTVSPQLSEIPLGGGDIVAGGPQAGGLTNRLYRVSERLFFERASEPLSDDLGKRLLLPGSVCCQRSIEALLKIELSAVHDVYYTS
jgi:hypothetical protein